MKITAVKPILLKWKCPIMSDAISVNQVRQALLVKVETDTEIYGIGEAFCYGSPLRVGQAIIEDQLAPILVGQDPTDIERLWQTMYWRTIANGRRGVVMAAISGVDIALWDILGKACGMPVYKLLGAHSELVPAYASGGFYAPGKDLDRFREEMEGYIKKGYSAIKVKIGRDPEMADNALRYMANQDFAASYEEDIKRLEIAREALGPKGLLATDTNAAWSVRQILDAKDDLNRVHLNWLEEPIRFEDTDGCRQIRQHMPEISVIGYETEQGVTNFRKLIENDQLDIVQPDIGWGGGISELRKIGAVALAAHKPVSLHSFGSAVHFAASLQVAASLANTLPIESEENQNALKTGITTAPFEHDAHMNYYVPQQPGIGIDLDWDALENYIVR